MLDVHIPAYVQAFSVLQLKHGQDCLFSAPMPHDTFAWYLV
jgi:hypothetical protein